MRVALVHDYLNQYGGAERVLEVLHEMYPQAPVFTILHNPQKLPGRFREWTIVTSFVQHLPLVERHYEKYFFLFPMAVEGFDLDGFDVVISVSSAWAKGIITTTDTFHVCYCLSPMRFAWFWYHPTVFKEPNRLKRTGLQYLLNRIRVWDVVSSNRVDCFLATSSLVKRRITKYYRRESEVIPPPVNCDFFRPGDKVRPGEYFLVVSRMRPYKALEIVVRSFNELGLPLFMVGEGSLRRKLEDMSKPNIHFLGHLSDQDLLRCYQGCTALVFPTLEDFGIVPLEANACGRPVIAFGGGGAAETLAEGESAVFFRPQTSEALTEAVRSFDPSTFAPEIVRKNALRFDKSSFKQRVEDFVNARWEEQKAVVGRLEGSA